MISYAYNLEDVLLMRVFGHLETGFWVDVGACHPLNGSLTKALSDRGWRGINIEPIPLLGVNFDVERPRDINLTGSAVGDHEGDIVVYQVMDSGFTTTVPAMAERWRELPQNKLRMSLTTLRSICEVHVLPGQEIHFLTVDVEGGEAAVLRGADFSRWRPWLLVIEATEPISTVQTHSAWEPILIQADYDFALFDGVNRFYIAREHPELRLSLSFPADSYDKAFDLATRRALERALIGARSVPR